ncbi:NADH dehydrogenase I chain M [Buchnera aphidicola BCc]|uniref:NADH-quinone oxidoreductase subunit M n=2 Tax=Buchnera aphidicola TaxID=9 RepID=Q057W4_BUCCC|nr:NADH dehydrogenase I chain M [Buchnera aphidicola BCc]
MIVLTSIFGLFSVFCEWHSKQKNSGIFYSFLLLIISGMFGIFLSLDLFLFFLFWEMILIPLYFLIVFWGNINKNKKNNIFIAHKFFIYSQLSGCMLLFFIINLVCCHYNYSKIWTFDYFLLKNTPVSLFTEFFLMFFLLLSFIIKIPLIPFHSWLPDVQECLPTTNSIDLIGILLKPAIYGILRFNLIFFPHSSYLFSRFFMIFGLLSTLYGSIMAFSQKNIKKFIAYSSISSMGIIFSSIYSFNFFSHQGIILYLFSYCISTAALLIIIGKIFSHIYTQKIFKMGGLWNYMRFIPSFFLFFIFSNLNIPMSGNFGGEFMMLFGIFSSFPFLGYFFILNLFFSSIYSLVTIQKVCYGLNNNFFIKHELSFFDFFILFFLVFMIFFLGLYPSLILNFSFNIQKNIFQHYIFIK